MLANLLKIQEDVPGMSRHTKPEGDIKVLGETLNTPRAVEH